MKPTVLPENILRLMPKEVRSELGKAGMTAEEALAKSTIKSERELHKQIGNYLSLKGILFRHDRMDRATTGNIGWPDFTFAFKGVPCAIEAKTKEGKLSPEQVQTISKMTEQGWRVCVVRSLDDVIKFLESV